MAMTAREALQRIFTIHLHCLVEQRKENETPFLEEVMAWHTTHRSQVTREAVEKVLSKHKLHHDCGDLRNEYCQCWTKHQKVIDDLLALLNNEPKRCPTCHQEISDETHSSR